MSWQGPRIEEISAGHSYSLSGWKIKVHLKRKGMYFSAMAYLLGDCLLWSGKSGRRGGKAKSYDKIGSLWGRHY